MPQGRRSRTNRTYRTYRTAADAALNNGFACRPAGALLYLLNLLHLLNQVVCASAPLPQSMACEARHAPQALRAGRAPLVEVWKFRGLEAWSLHSASPVAPQGRSVLRSPFSVLWGASAPLVQRALARPQSATNLRNLRFLILAVLLRASSWSFVPLRVSPAGQTFHTLPAVSPVARVPRALFSVLRSLFSVLCSLGRVSAPHRSSRKPRSLLLREG